MAPALPPLSIAVVILTPPSALFVEHLWTNSGHTLDMRRRFFFAISENIRTFAPNFKTNIIMKHNVLFYRGYGKVGNLVGYSIYGKQAFRAHQPVVRNPKSAAQTTQRAKISLLTARSIVFRAAARLGFSDEARARGCSAVNYFVHMNYPYVTGTAPDNVALDPARIVCAKGNVPPVTFSSSIGTSTPGAITMTVTDINMGVEGASDDDDIYCFAYCPDAEAGILSTPTKRINGASIVIRYPQSWSGLEVQVYGFVVNQEKASSNSERIGHAELG